MVEPIADVSLVGQLCTVVQKADHYQLTNKSVNFYVFESVLTTATFTRQRLGFNTRSCVRYIASRLLQRYICGEDQYQQ